MGEPSALCRDGSTDRFPVLLLVGSGAGLDGLWGASSVRFVRRSVLGLSRLSEQILRDERGLWASGSRDQTSEITFEDPIGAHSIRIEERPPIKPLPRSVKALGWTSFFTDFSTEMIYPLIPNFLTKTLNATPVVLGLIEGVAESTAAILKLFSGYWSDRFKKRKPLVVGGYAISSFWPLIAWAPTWPLVLLLRFVNRIGKGVRTSPRDALIADWTAPKDRGAAFGFQRSLDHAGAMVGPLAAAALLQWWGCSLRTVFLVALVPGVIVFFILVLGVKDKTAKNTVSRNDIKPARGLSASWTRMGKPFWWYLLSLLVFTLGNSTDAFLLLKLNDVGVSSIGILLLWSAHHLVKSVCTFWGGRLSDKVGRRTMILAGWGVYALVYLAFSVVSGKEGLIAVFLAYGIYFGLTEPVEKAWVADMAPKDMRGSAFGWYHLTIGLAALPASLLFGWIWMTWSPGCAFITGACLAGVAAVMLLMVGEKKKV
jgi:MFS family permease